MERERERERVVCNGRGCAMVVCRMTGVGGLWERLTAKREREREREREWVLSWHLCGGC